MATTSNKTKLGQIIRSALKERSTKQKEFADQLGIPPPELSDYLNGKRTVSVEILVRMATLLQLPLDQLLLANLLISCQRRKSEKSQTRESQANIDIALKELQAMLQKLQRSKPQAPERPCLTLEDDLFSKGGNNDWCLLAPDRREHPLQGLGDLIAISASTCDLMFLPALEMPPNTRIRSDKPIINRSSHLDRLEFLRANLLVVGSPAVSFATREILRKVGATFMFNISSETYEREQELYGRIERHNRYNPKALEQLKKEASSEIKGLLASFRQPGFVDPVQFKDIRGRSIRNDADYGMVALAPNPWSPEHLVCICAGVHGPGTAGALQLLADRDQFKHHPWGGVFSVTVPTEAPWEERFDFLNPTWDTPDYTPEQYLNHMKNLIDGVKSKRKRYPVIRKETLDSVAMFAKSLATPQ